MNYKFNDIQKKFEEVIYFSQLYRDIGPEHINCSDLFATWYKNKRKFIELFGDKLIYEFPDEVEINITEREKERLLYSFKNELTLDGDTLLENFIDYEEDGFFNNTVTRPYSLGSIKVPKGAKLIKSFKHFIKDDDEHLRRKQDEASNILQQNKIKGKLCFSVHPLDYLSLSENASNWTSCHRLDGDYRSGNLSYMVDDFTIICYIKGSDDCQITGFPEHIPWNDKHWRMLLFSGSHRFLAGRQYPLTSLGAYEVVADKLKELYQDKVSIVESEEDEITRFLSRSNWESGFLFYDDISAGTARVNLKEGTLDQKNLVNFWINSKSYEKEGRYDVPGCCICGRRIYKSETFLCLDCEYDYGYLEDDYITFCQKCGARLVTSSAYEDEENETYYCYGCKPLF